MLLISIVFLANATPPIVQGRGDAYSYLTLALAGVGLIMWAYANWQRRGKGDPGLLESTTEGSENRAAEQNR
jgi:hypothetical protein